jgi:hypothetical protein
MSCSDKEQPTNQEPYDYGSPSEPSLGTYVPRPVSETRVRTLIHKAIVQAGSGGDTSGRAFRPAI